jgi:hypothetical protein
VIGGGGGCGRDVFDPEIEKAAGPVGMLLPASKRILDDIGGSAGHGGSVAPTFARAPLPLCQAVKASRAADGSTSIRPCCR